MNLLLNLINNMKPLLLKLIPYELLRKCKRIIVKKSFKKLKKVNKQNFNRRKYLDGVNLIGNVKATTGLGQSCRLVASK